MTSEAEDERRPLLPSRPRTEVCSRYQRLWLADKNAAFARNVQLASRGSVAAVVVALPFLLPQTRDWVRPPEGSGIMYDSTAVLMLVFTLYKSFGETMRFAVAGLCGTVLAVLNIWMMLVLFEGGVKGRAVGKDYQYLYPEEVAIVHSADYVWWAGLLEGLLFTVTVLWLNFDLNLKMFALSWHVYFCMRYLHFSKESWEAQVGFGVVLRGNLDVTRSMLMTCIGAGTAVLASLFPYPILAIDMARASSEGVAATLASSWDDAIECFCDGSDNPITRDRLKHDVEVLKLDLVVLADHVKNAWWECLGYGHIERAREHLEILDRTLHESYDSILTVLHACEKVHASSRTMPEMTELRPQLKAVCLETGLLMKEVTAACSDGIIDAEEVSAISARRSATLEAMAALSTRLAGLGDGSEGSDLVEQRAFCLHFHGYGRLAVDMADVLLRYEGGRRRHDWVQSVKQIVLPSLLFSREHLVWVLRNTLSITVTFTIGYCGYHEMIQPYNWGPASTVSLLLSNFVGSATMKNLGRLQGVAMGTAVGQLAYTTLAWCNLAGHAAVVSFLFCWEMGTLYLYYSSAELGYMGCLLAAFGAQNLLQGCSSTDIFHPTALAHKVIDCVLGITVMTVVDLLLAPSNASVLAYKGYMDFWRDCRWALAEALDPEVESVRMRSGGLLRQLVQAEALGQEADKEPRFWRTPWKSSLWEEAIQSGYNMRLFLTSVEGAMAERGKNGGPKAKGMLRLLASPEFAKVREDVLAKLAALEGLLEALSWTKETDWYQVADPEKAVEDKEPGRAGMFVDTRPSERKHLARLAARLQSCVEEEEAGDAAAAGGGEGGVASKSLDDDLLCKASSATSALELQLAQLDRLKHKLLTL